MQHLLRARYSLKKNTNKLFHFLRLIKNLICIEKKTENELIQRQQIIEDQEVIINLQGKKNISTENKIQNFRKSGNYNNYNDRQDNYNSLLKELASYKKYREKEKNNENIVQSLHNLTDLVKALKEQKFPKIESQNSLDGTLNNCQELIKVLDTSYKTLIMLLDLSCPLSQGFNECKCQNQSPFCRDLKTQRNLVSDLASEMNSLMKIWKSEVDCLSKIQPEILLKIQLETFIIEESEKIKDYYLYLTCGLLNAGSLAQCMNAEQLMQPTIKTQQAVIKSQEEKSKILLNKLRKELDEPSIM